MNTRFFLIGLYFSLRSINERPHSQFCKGTARPISKVVLGIRSHGSSSDDYSKLSLYLALLSHPDQPPNLEEPHRNGTDGEHRHGRGIWPPVE